MPSAPFPGRVGILQQWLPPYRDAFFDLLATRFEGGVSVCAGESPDGQQPSPSRLTRAVLHPVQTKYWLKGPLLLMPQFGVKEWLEQADPDVLVAFPNPRMPSVFQAVNWMKRRGRPCVAWGIGLMVVHRGVPLWLRNLARRPALRRFDGIIAYGSRAASEYREVGYPGDRIRIAYNATALRPTRHPGPRSAFGTRSPVIVCLGQLTPPKQVDRLISACATVQRMRGRSIDLWIIGDGTERAPLERQAAAELPQTRFWGQQRGEQLQALLRQADILVMPGMGGLAIQEAMAAGLPVIVAEGDGTQADLVRESNGWNIPVDDQSALVAAIEDALSDPERLLRMGAESYRIVREEINLEAMVDAYSSALNEVIQRSHRRQST
jgi:glycosyltransferase involved in cell wall biosynthesis